jgi:hypothetical protein
MSDDTDAPLIDGEGFAIPPWQEARQAPVFITDMVGVYSGLGLTLGAWLKARRDDHP